MKKMIIAFLFVFFSSFLIACKDEKTPEKLSEHMPDMIYETLLSEIAYDDVSTLKIESIDYNFYDIEIENDEGLVETGIIGLFWVTYTLNDEEFSAFIQLSQETQSMEKPYYSLVSDVKTDYDTMIEDLKRSNLDEEGYDIIKYETQSGKCLKSEITTWLDAAINMVNGDGSPLKIQITSDSGLEMVLGGRLDWSTTLTSSQIMSSINEYYPNGFTLDPITSPNGQHFYKPINNRFEYTNEGFISIPIYFRSQTSQYVYLEDITMTSSNISYTSPISFTNGKNEFIQSGSSYFVSVSDAARIAVNGWIDGTRKTIIYENPVSVTNTVIGYKNNESLENYNGSIDYYKQLTGHNPPGILEVTLPETHTDINHIQVLKLDPAGDIYQGQLVLTVWIEGWDLECYESIIGLGLDISLSFSQ